MKHLYKYIQDMFNKHASAEFRDVNIIEVKDGVVLMKRFNSTFDDRPYVVTNMRLEPIHTENGKEDKPECFWSTYDLTMEEGFELFKEKTSEKSKPLHTKEELDTIRENLFHQDVHYPHKTMIDKAVEVAQRSELTHSVLIVDDPESIQGDGGEWIQAYVFVPYGMENQDV